MSISKFYRSSMPGRTGNTYVCRICAKRTRDTGNDEAGIELCYRCMKVCEAENAASDSGEGSPEHVAALAAIPKAAR